MSCIRLKGKCILDQLRSATWQWLCFNVFYYHYCYLIFFVTLWGLKIAWNHTCNHGSQCYDCFCDFHYNNPLLIAGYSHYFEKKNKNGICAASTLIGCNWLAIKLCIVLFFPCISVVYPLNEMATIGQTHKNWIPALRKMHYLLLLC